MTTLTQVIEALTAKLETIGGLKGYDYAAAAEFPSVTVMPPDINYRETMGRGCIGLNLELLLFVSAADAMKVKDLYPYMDWEGDQSIVKLIDDDIDLGFDDLNCHVVAARPLGLEEVALYSAYGAAFTVQLYATNPS